jgi:hypothetical protein
MISSPTLFNLKVHSVHGSSSPERKQHTTGAHGVAATWLYWLSTAIGGAVLKVEGDGNLLAVGLLAKNNN